MRLTGEDAVQAEVIRLLRESGAVAWHTPNEGKHKPIYRAKQMAMGMAVGMSDVLVVSPAYCALEIKVGRNKPTTAQLAWLETFRLLGWNTGWATGLDACVALLRTWGALP